MDQAPEHKRKISDGMSNGKSTERRVLSVLSYGILYTCFYSGVLQAIQPCEPQSKKHMGPYRIEYTGRTVIPQSNRQSAFITKAPPA